MGDASLFNMIPADLVRIDNLSEEARKGMQEKAEQGIWPTVAQLGYRNVAGSDGKRSLSPILTQRRSSPLLFEGYATGTLSLKEAAEKASSGSDNGEFAI